MTASTALALILGVANPGAAAPGPAEFERVPVADYELLRQDALHAYYRHDYPAAFPRLRRLACAGDKPSQFLLGRMYILGQGTAKDELAGYAWIRLAAEFRFSDYTALAAKLAQALPTDRRTEGEAAAEDLRRRYGLLATGIGCRAESRHGGYLLDSVICTPPSDGSGLVRLRRCDPAP
jgi:hypothetical protein